jgi:hypothetical protein
MAEISLLVTGKVVKRRGRRFQRCGCAATSELRITAEKPVFYLCFESSAKN